MQMIGGQMGRTYSLERMICPRDVKVTHSWLKCSYRVRRHTANLQPEESFIKSILATLGKRLMNTRVRCHTYDCARLRSKCQSPISVEEQTKVNRDFNRPDVWLILD